MAEEFNNEELEFTPEVVQEEVAPIVVEEPVEAPAPVAEESAVVEEAPAPAPAPAPKKKAKKSAPKVEKKAPGMYYQGSKITAIPARLGRKWTIIIDGKRTKVLAKDIEIVK